MGQLEEEETNESQRQIKFLSLIFMFSIKKKQALK